MSDESSTDSLTRTAVVPVDPVPSEVRAAQGERELERRPMPAQIGRFTVIRLLGRGGMGIVFAAYDERLDRKLAIKLLRPHVREGTEGRTRILREAQAMAKLSHPNVAQVYEVGEHDGAVFVAMEFVDGDPLRTWMERPQEWQEVLRVMIEAGQGLAAAHARGLVHRDFKPDNVLISKDGRPRVVDFGLARSARVDDDEPQARTAPGAEDPLATDITHEGAVVGTPAYMSPEQHLGDPADARSDQFSFCVTTYEALFGLRPFTGQTRAELAGATVNKVVQEPPASSRVPAWVRKAVLRGLEPESEDRWPSMDALLTVLRADPSKARRNRLALAGIGLAGVVVGVMSLRSPPAQADTCAFAGDELTGVWDQTSRASAADAFARLEVAYAGDLWPKVESVLDDYAGQWVEMRGDACRARQRGEQSAAVHDQRVLCLDRRLDEMKALIEVLADPDEQTAERAVQAAHGLECLTECEDSDRIAVPVDLVADVQRIRTQVGRARTLANAGRFDASLEVARAAHEDAGTLDHRPLTAETGMALARALQRTGDAASAQTLLEACVHDAIASKADQQAADCATQLVYTVGEKLGQYDGALRWADLALALLERGAGDELLAARLSMQTGNVLRSAGKYDEAIQYQLQAIEQFERVHGPDHPDVGVARNNLGGVQWRLGNLAGARQNMEAGLRIRRKAFGDRHPQVASSLNNLGIVLASEGRYEDAKTKHEQALALKRDILGQEHPSVAYSLHNLGDTLHRLGQLEAARARLREALAMRERLVGTEHPSVADTLASIGAVLVDAERYEEALVPLERSLDISNSKLGAEHPDLADPLTGYGRALLGQGHAAKAIEPLQRALDIRLRDKGAAGPRGETRLALARAHAASGDAQQAQTLLAEAVKDLDETSMGYQAARARAQALTRELSDAVTD
jgi:tetratricopeptide (TPR) repeat protein/predicted Ser/Thr protein kinase